MSKFFKTISDTIKNSWLCLRFPFLYPRNVFTGRRTTRVLGNVCYRLYEKSIQEVNIHAVLEKESFVSEDTLKFSPDFFVTLDKESRELIITYHSVPIIYSLKHLLWDSDDKFEILGISINSNYRPSITVHVMTADKSDKTNYGFSCYVMELIKNKHIYSLRKILSWIDKEILDRIFFLPTYSNLDAMPKGWRKAFGIGMCKEIKAALKQDKLLKRYRITQIKEKFGGLRWYDNVSTDKVQAVISKYEHLSYKTCIECGKPAKYISKGWISPYCEDCAVDKSKYVPMDEEDAWSKALGDY